MANAQLVRDVAIPAGRRAAYEAAGYWDQVTLTDRIDQWAALQPGAIAIVDQQGARRADIATLRDHSRRAASLLLSAGVGPGDVVAVQMPNWYEAVVFGLATLRLGAVLNPLIPTYGAKELRHMLTVGATRAIVTPDRYRSANYAERVGEATSELGHSVHHIRVPEPTDDFAGLERLLAGVEPLAAEPARSAETVSMLLFTSGTESMPKAILHTEQTTGCGVREMYRFLGLGGADVVWMPMPIGHSTGFNFGLRFALHHQLKIVLQDRWDAATGIRLCRGEGVSLTAVSPTHLLDMLGVLRENPVDLSQLRYFGCAGAPIPDGVVEAAAEFGITVLRGYGSTEALPIAKGAPHFSAAERAKTDGQVMPSVELELRDDAGEAVPRGESGEIFSRSPQSCVGFAPAPDGSPLGSLSADGWIRSGDLGVLDEQRFLTIVGRKKEIIIRGGMNVAPREIEEALIKHPKVARAAVIGLADARLGESVCACIVPSGGGTTDFDSIIAHLKALDIASYKLPTRVEVFDALPMTDTGKVKKPELAALVLGRDRER